MLEPAEVKLTGLQKKLELNLHAQAALQQEEIEQRKLYAKINSDRARCRTSVKKTLNSYTDYPTAENRRQLQIAREEMKTAETACKHFDLLAIDNDLTVLRDLEEEIRKSIRSLKKNEGSDCFKAEHEKLKAQLIIDLPRFLALTGVLTGVGPGRMDVNASLLFQLNYRPLFDQAYKDALAELEVQNDV